jgi:hypothetical protein
MEKLKLQSRYKDVETYFHPIDENSGAITSNGAYVRRILSPDEEAIKAIDFEGGPMLSVGDVLYDNKKIKSIKCCYYIELE